MQHSMFNVTGDVRGHDKQRDIDAATIRYFTAKAKIAEMEMELNAEVKKELRNRIKLQEKQMEVADVKLRVLLLKEKK